MRIYISGRISGLSHETAYNAFEAGEGSARIHFSQHCFIRSLDSIYCINPMKEVVQTSDLTYNDLMRKDIKLLMDCAGIWMMKGWKESKGATFEHYIAQWLGMAIGYEND